MSYVFFPPRTENFFPPGPPYLAGMRGLGDYAADLAAYKTDLSKWRLESLKYASAIKAYDAKVKAIDAAYAAAVASYTQDKARWDSEYAAYLVAAKNWNAAFATYQKQNAARAQTIASSYGLNLTPAFYSAGACVTQAQHDAYARNCTTVKGIGQIRGLGSSDSDCGGKALPVCQFGPFPTVRPQPTPPQRAAYPAKPSPLRPEPVAPTAPAVTTPSSGGGGSWGTSSGGGGAAMTPTPDTTPAPETPTADDYKQSNVLMGGLLVAAMLGGGYLVYRTLKKPKAQAA